MIVYNGCILCCFLLTSTSIMLLSRFRISPSTVLCLCLHSVFMLDYISKDLASDRSVIQVFFTAHTLEIHNLTYFWQYCPHTRLWKRISCKKHKFKIFSLCNLRHYVVISSLLPINNVIRTRYSNIVDINLSKLVREKKNLSFFISPPTLETTRFYIIDNKLLF